MIYGVCIAVAEYLAETTKGRDDSVHSLEQ